MSNGWKVSERWQLFGGILPFIGWRTIAVDQNGDLIDPETDGFDPNIDYDGISVFCISWFNWCAILKYSSTRN